MFHFSVSLKWPAYFFLRLKMSNENNEIDEIENLLQGHETRRQEELLQLLENKASLMDRELRVGRQLIEKLRLVGELQSKLLQKINGKISVENSLNCIFLDEVKETEWEEKLNNGKRNDATYEFM